MRAPLQLSFEYKKEEKIMPRRPLSEMEKTWQKNLRRIWDEKRHELGLTQEKLADMIGWKGQGAVQSYFSGRIALNTDAKVSFAKALGVSVLDIDPAFDVAARPVPRTREEALAAILEIAGKLPNDEKILLIGEISSALAQLIAERRDAIKEPKARA